MPAWYYQGYVRELAVCTDSSLSFFPPASTSRQRTNTSSCIDTISSRHFHFRTDTASGPALLTPHQFPPRPCLVRPPSNIQQRLYGTVCYTKPSLVCATIFHLVSSDLVRGLFDPGLTTCRRSLSGFTAPRLTCSPFQSAVLLYHNPER